MERQVNYGKLAVDLSRAVKSIRPLVIIAFNLFHAQVTYQMETNGDTNG